MSSLVSMNLCHVDHHHKDGADVYVVKIQKFRCQRVMFLMIEMRLFGLSMDTRLSVSTCLVTQLCTPNTSLISLIVIKRPVR